METEIINKKLKIVDAHAHIFPQKVAKKATINIGKFYNLNMSDIGNSTSLVESGSRIGIRKYLVCSVATKPEQVSPINDFIMTQCQKNPEFLGFAAMHPEMDDYKVEIERIYQMGLRGIKFHPDFQQFNIDDPKALPIYREIAKLKLPVLFHTGDNRYDFSAPKRLHNVLQEIPDLLCIAAHFGGYRRWDEAYAYLREDPLHFDTCSSLFRLKKEEAVWLIRHLGVEKFLFGTDFPMWDHAEELDRFLALDLTLEERDKILYQNFEKMFNITI